MSLEAPSTVDSRTQTVYSGRRTRRSVYAKIEAADLSLELPTAKHLQQELIHLKLNYTSDKWTLESLDNYTSDSDGNTMMNSRQKEL